MLCDNKNGGLRGSRAAGQPAWITVVMAVGHDKVESNDPLSIYIKVLFGLC